MSCERLQCSIQVNLCQKLLFLHQLTHNMTTDCSLNYKFSTRKLQVQYMLCAQIVFCFDIQNNLCTQHVLSLYWTGKSMNNCGLVDVRISASDKDLPVKNILLYYSRLQTKARKRECKRQKQIITQMNLAWNTLKLYLGILFSVHDGMDWLWLI